MNIIGQNHVLRYLSQGLSTGSLSPSLLFVGADGTGKMKTAIQLAMSYFCEGPKSTHQTVSLACGKCSSCRKIEERNHIDVLVVSRTLQATILREKPESQTAVKIDMVRHIDKFLHLKSSEGKNRVVIIEEAHKLTDEAANALLKLLEEPPNQAQIILIGNDEHSLPSTIISRCAVLHFKLIAAVEISKWLQEKHHLPQTQADEIADAARGSFAKALELKDEEPSELNLANTTLEDFFDLLANPQFRRESRSKAEKIINHLISEAQKKLDKGDLTQMVLIKTFLAARQQIDRNVSPKLVLENMYLKIEPFLSSTHLN